MTEHHYVELTKSRGRIPPIGWLTIIGGVITFVVLIVVVNLVVNKPVAQPATPRVSQLGQAYKPDNGVLLGRALRSDESLLVLHTRVFSDSGMVDTVRAQLYELSPSAANAANWGAEEWSEFDRLSLRASTSEVVLRQSCRLYENRARYLAISHDVYYVGLCPGFPNN